MKHYLIAGVLLAALLAASFFIPTQVMEWQDKQKIGSSETQEVQEVVLKEQVSMTMTQRLAFLDTSRDDVDTLQLANGKNYTQDTIEAQVLGEIRILAEQGVLKGMDLESLHFNSANVFFFVDLEDTEKSMMLWSGNAYTEMFELDFSLDDESGKIVSISCRWNVYGPFMDVRDESKVGDVEGKVAVSVSERNDSLNTEEIKEIAQNWGAYLGCTVTDAGYSTPSYLDSGMENEFWRYVDEMMAKGYSEEVAYWMVTNQWGIVEEGMWGGRKMILSDGGGQVEYGFYAGEGTILNIYL